MARSTGQQANAIFSALGKWNPLNYFSYNAGLMAHFLGQTLYVIASFWLFGLQRDWRVWILFLVFTATLHLQLEKRRLISWDGRIPITGLVIGNSIFLNLDSGSIWILALTFLIGTSARLILRTGNNLIFNPSIFGIFAVCMLLPQYASPATTGWLDSTPFQMVVLCTGCLVSIVAKRFFVSLSYQLGAIIFSIVINFISIWTRGSPVFGSYWLVPSILLGVGPMIFTYHVITDPQTTPKKWYLQMIFGGAIGGIQAALMAFSILPPDIIAYLTVLIGASFIKAKHFSEPLKA